MKKIYLTLLSIFAINANSQTCTRYYSDVFSTVTTSSAIQFGSNTSWNGSGTTNLMLDFYQPSGDAQALRPLIIFAHGGSFLGGTRTDADQVALCNAFAKKGYVTASIDYRTGFFPFDSANIVPALVRAYHDMKAAIRFFYKDARTANLYKVDTNFVFIGGSSAGAITALHVAYLNEQCEMEPYMSTTAINALGGIEGNSGNPGYPSKIKGVINICGALGKYWWMKTGDVPLCSLHGTADATVLYGQGKANPGFQTLYLDGSRMLYAGTQISNVPHKFYTWYGAGHVPYGSNAAYMDSTISFVRDFLLPYVNCSNTATLLPNTPAGTVNAYSYTPCTPSSIKEIANHLNFVAYPNPTNGELNFKFTEFNTYQINIYTTSGKLVFSEKLDGAVIKINPALLSGIYFVKINDNTNKTSNFKLLVE
ncbi:MAG: T9SS type A sorting domain-containing protein [Bacteroidetes bacterium]|nr:T9SS type A sorting domain-containing protein [Bacteroidota bacterium]